MPFKTDCEEILLNKKAAEELSQVLLEGDVIVPDISPDISEILRIGGDVYITDYTISDDRINFKGRLDLTILYYSKKSETPVHSMSSSLNFEDYISLDNYNNVSNVNFKTKIEHLEHSLINDRKVNIKSVISVIASIFEEKELNIIKDISDCPSIQLKKGTICANNALGNKKDRFVIKEEVPIPSSFPNIGEILCTDIIISDKESRVNEDRVNLKGILNMKILYSGENSENAIEFIESEIPFNGFIDLKGAHEGMIVSSNLKVADKYIKVIPDEDGEPRIIDAEITLNADINASENIDTALVEDVYDLVSPLKVTKENVTYPVFIGKNKTLTSLKETIVLDQKYPDALKVCCVWADVSVNSVEAVNDIINIYGTVDIQIMYMAKSDEEPIKVYQDAIPFDQQIEIKGLYPGMAADVDCSLENISFSLLSEREIDLRITISFESFAFKNIICEIITNVEVDDENQNTCSNLASMVIYVVKKGDTLWKIAKRFNTTVADIASINNIPNPDKIDIGQKLLILKRVK